MTAKISPKRASKPAVPVPAQVGAIGVDENEISRLTNMSLSWLRKDRRTRRIIPFAKIGDRVIYNPQRVQEAIRALEVGGQA